MSAAEGGRRIFFAGASGVIGRRLVPMLVQAGHTVGAMTRSAAKADGLAFLGAQPIICDVFDRPGLTSAVRVFSPQAELPPNPRVHIDTAAARTLQALESPSGIVTVVSA
ncbi:NAD(P)H-binding protein [Mycolicibacter senuensis]|uniref:NAD(P)H-binding protein n=1 Tax=Mycolicibacter senuensis TaxID=386913 RepID=UPI000DCBE884|nr:NAD(P)H-binding protein [Mycolicibacter senuensis]RAU97370.1 hypothetical protein DQP56_13760 [Mycolicibacter senuensis]